jgi:hypothetical protein
VPAGSGRRDLSFSAGVLGPPAFSGVAENAPGEYTLDAGGDPDVFTGPVAGAGTGSYDSGTSGTVNTGSDRTTGLQWGRWTGGGMTVSVGAEQQAVDLGLRSLAWVMSADADTPPVLPQVGNATYTFAGGTAPVDQSGNQGILNGAVLDADFTNAIVTTSLDFTLGATTWDATGTGAIGAQANVADHHFAGALNVSIGGGQSPTGTGTFAGFFVAPGGSTPGVPGGAGMTFSVSDDAGLQNVQGAIALREGNPP